MRPPNKVLPATLDIAALPIPPPPAAASLKCTQRPKQGGRACDALSTPILLFANSPTVSEHMSAALDPILGHQAEINEPSRLCALSQGCHHKSDHTPDRSDVPMRFCPNRQAPYTPRNFRWTTFRSVVATRSRKQSAVSSPPTPSSSASHDL
jgi:hypothetical protein